MRGRRGARLTAVTSGGTIPDTADYAVLLEPQGTQVGTVNEDFAVESLAGDVFQLGNQSYRILRVETGRVRVEDAQGQPPNIPFWLGEAPGRSDELSASVARLRDTLDELLEQGELAAAAPAASRAIHTARSTAALAQDAATDASTRAKAATKATKAGTAKSASRAALDPNPGAKARPGAELPPAGTAPLAASTVHDTPEPSRLAPALDWLTGRLGLAPEAARQIVEYLARARQALGALPGPSTRW